MRNLVLALSLSSVLILAACGKQEETAPAVEPAPAPEAAAPAAEAAPAVEEAAPAAEETPAAE